MKNLTNITRLAIASIISIFDKEGEKTYYDGHDEMITKKTANGLYKYSPNGRLVYHKDIEKNSQCWFYKDGGVRRLKTQYGDYRYNEEGSCIYCKSPSGAEYYYDNDGNKIREIVDGNVRNFLYNERRKKNCHD